jgi:hypothetical protein
MQAQTPSPAEFFGLADGNNEQEPAEEAARTAMASGASTLEP